MTDLLMLIRAAALSEPQREYQLAPPRRWRFDYCYPDRRLAQEVEGGMWTRGRHVRGRGYTDDCAKYNEAALRGWCVLRFTVDMIRDGRALAMLERAFARARDSDGA